MNRDMIDDPEPATVSEASRWPLERVLFAMAGTASLVSAALAAAVSSWFLLLAAFVGVNQWLYVTFRACPASLVLKRFGTRGGCTWQPTTAADQPAGRSGELQEHRLQVLE